MTLIRVAFIVLLLAVAAGRWRVRRVLSLLTVDQKAQLFDVSGIGNVWSLITVAVAVALFSFGPSFLPSAYVPGYFGAFFVALFLGSFAATVVRLRRVAHLSLPSAYVRASVFRAVLYLVALLFFVSAVIPDGATYLHRRLQPAQSSNPYVGSQA